MNLVQKEGGNDVGKGTMRERECVFFLFLLVLVFLLFLLHLSSLQEEGQGSSSEADPTPGDEPGHADKSRDNGERGREGESEGERGGLISYEWVMATSDHTSCAVDSSFP